MIVELIEANQRVYFAIQYDFGLIKYLEKIKLLIRCMRLVFEFMLENLDLIAF